jgi:hypothetical protein
MPGATADQQAQIAQNARGRELFGGFCDPGAVAPNAFVTVAGPENAGTIQRGATTGLWHVQLTPNPAAGTVQIIATPQPKAGGVNPLTPSYDQAVGGFDVTTYDVGTGSGGGLVVDTPVYIGVYAIPHAVEG